MSALAWMVHTVLVGGLVTGAACALDRARALRGGSRRWIWAGALGLSVMIPAWGLLVHGAGGTTPGDVQETVVGGAPDIVAVPERDRGLLAEVFRTSTAAATHARALTQRAGRGVQHLESALAGRVAPGSTLDRVVPPLWFLLTLAGTTVLIASAVRLGHVRRRWFRQRVQGEDVLVSPSTGPAVVGTFRPEIVLPAWSLRLDPEDLQFILRHEREHVAAGDTRLLAVGIAAVLVMPWNLALWYQLRRLREGVELDCDRRLLREGVPRHRYARILVAVAARSGSRPLPALALAEGPTFLERRIEQMTRSHVRLPKLAPAAATLAAVALLAVACDTEPPVAPTADDPDAGTTAELNADALEVHQGRLPFMRPEAEAPRVDANDGGLVLKGERILLPFTGDAHPGRPLFVVDGVILAPGPLDFDLDPERIERIEVIRGAAAVGRYGERGANGVVLVTTRAGALERERP